MKIIEYFEGVEVIREHKGYFYSVGQAIAIVILGSMSGLKNLHEIHQWATHDKVRAFLSEEFGISRIPCYYWLTILVKIIDPESLNECFNEWIQSLIPEGESVTIAVDGKEIRSMRKKNNPLNIISAQIAEYGLTIAQEAVTDKKNEIPAVQELLKKLKIKGCLITADALHCQTKTAEIIIEKKADYLLKVKGNQREMMKQIKEYVEDEDLRREMDFVQTIEKNRSRIERRTAYTTHNIEWLYGKEKWSKLKCIGAIRSEVTHKGKTTVTWHYYISSLALSAEELLKRARLEWSVEAMHWLLDVHFKEDQCRITEESTQRNLNIFRKVAINYVKMYKEKYKPKSALNHIMFDCLMEPYLLKSLLFEN